VDAEKKAGVLVPAERIEKSILLIRGRKVMLDTDLAALYGVSVKALNQAVKRNLDRFPDDFMFQLEWEEVGASRSQIVTLKRGQNPKYRPYAFTEHGVAMLSSVLKSKRAVHVNIEIMRAFVRLRKYLAAHREIVQRLDEHDARFQVVFDAIRRLMEPSTVSPKRRIGFRPDEGKK
jgi:hypothetical protein